jgi:predicted nucleic acid-binding protein
MKSDKLVVNASPIISLAKIGCADFLSGLSDQLVIPEGVFAEISAHKEHDRAIEWIKAQDYQATVRSIEVPAIISEWNLGKGESQVIAFALQNKDFAAAIDDKAAKKCAEVFNISISGTIALIINARKRGLAQKVEPLLLALRSNGFRVSDNITHFPHPF